MHRKIKVCAGIGDNIWLIQKLINAGEKFDFVLAGDIPRRGKQIFDLVPQLVHDNWYDSSFSSQLPIDNNIQNTHKTFKDIPYPEFCLSINYHLEQGHRIEGFFPDLKTSFRIKYNTRKFKPTSDGLLKNKKANYIGIYGSCYSALRHWKFWKEEEWMELITKLYAENNNFVFVIIGADWDIDLGRNLCDMLSEKKIPFVNSIGYELGVVIEIMKRLDYFLSFPSGLGILSTSLNVSTTMFYPGHLQKMVNAWADPKMINSGVYYGSFFCDPAQTLEWLKNEYKLLDKLK